jgi:hypothetical protein
MLFLSVIALFAALVLAGSDRAQQAAGAHFERGVTLAAQGAYAASLAEFEEAYRLAPAWQVLLNIGVVREKLGQPTLALEAFDAYLEQGGSGVPRDKRQQVEAERAMLRRQVAELVVTVEGGAATLEIDGEARAAAQIYVLPGHHQVTARREGSMAHTEVDAHPGDRIVVALALAAPEPAPPPVIVEVTRPPEPLAEPPPQVALTPVAPLSASAESLRVAPVAQLEAPRPWYRRWYVWTAVGAVVLAGAVTAVAVIEKRPGYDVRIDTP